MLKIFNRLKNEAESWARGRSYLVRLPLLIFFVFTLIKHLGDPGYGGILFGINLGIHELGHIILSPFGTFLHVLGGTLAQCLFPVYVGFGFYTQSEFFGLALCSGWISANLFHIAHYMADAKSMDLPLVSVFGGHTIHDWNYLLGGFGLLGYAGAFAAVVRLSAVIMMLFCFYAASWLLWKMYAPQAPDK